MSAARKFHISDAVQNLVRDINQNSQDLRSRYGNQNLQVQLALESLHARCRHHSLGEEMTLRLQDMVIEDVERANSHCESPIERIVLPWLLAQDYGTGLGAMPARVHIPKDDTHTPKCNVFIVPQFAFAKFRVDFALVGRLNHHTKIIAVECDGEEFHEHTKDIKRDAYLASWGVPTVRRRGADISRDPSHIAAIAGSLLIEWADSMGAKYG